MAVGPFKLSRHHLDTPGKRANVLGREIPTLEKRGPEEKDRNVGVR